MKERRASEKGMEKRNEEVGTKPTIYTTRSGKKYYIQPAAPKKSKKRKGRKPKKPETKKEIVRKAPQLEDQTMNEEIQEERNVVSEKNEVKQVAAPAQKPIKKELKAWQKCLPTAIAIVLILAIASGMYVTSYFRKRFLPNTYINELDCSNLTAYEAYNKVNDVIASAPIEFIFCNTTYTVTSGELGKVVENQDEFEALLENQDVTLIAFFETHTYSIENVREVDNEKINEYLTNLDELKLENMVAPKDAFVKVDGNGLLAIENEVLGNEINYDEALALATSALANGETTVDFRSITNVEPQIFSTDMDLIEQVTSVNEILTTVITINLGEAGMQTLDIETMKSWVVKDEDTGKFYVSYEKLPGFVKEMNKVVQENTGVLTFCPAESDTVIPLPGSIKVEIDQAEQVKELEKHLNAKETCTIEPIFKDVLVVDKNLDHVEIDLTRQQVWMFVGGECVVNTKCVSGNVAKNHDTPTGIYHLTYKARNRYLKGYYPDGRLEYSTFVNYWMPFNGGVGMHDANWRNQFGGEIYKTNGSHGCVNMPLEAAKTVYGYINSTMPIIVYQT